MSRRTGSIPPGTTLGRYRVDSLLGAGGMGEVYSARDEQLGREVALKILVHAGVDRFVREAQLASSLNHPAIVTVFDSGVATLDDGRTVHFLAMERIDGEPLTVWAHANRDPRKIAELFAAIADGLARAHAGGIVHRDLKPQNIMVARGGHPKILDFGIAKLVDRQGSVTDTAPSQTAGTAAYMSPEQVEGIPVDHRTDIFSFGAVLHEVLTGKPPFARANAVESMHAVLHDDAPALPVAPELARIVRKCLVKDRDERYQSIKDVAIDLREFARQSQSHRAKRTMPRIGTIAAAVVVLAIAILLSRGRRSPEAIAAPAPPEPVMIRLTNSGNVCAGAVSPDGKYLVYATVDGENETVWVKQIATGTNVRIIPPAPVYYYGFKVSNDSNYAFYTVTTRAEPNVVDLRSIPILGGESRMVAHDIEPEFTIAPDGHRAAFLRFNAFERLYRVVMADIDSGAETQLLARPYPGMVGWMDWSPDGKTITFVGVRQGRKPFQPGLFNLHLTTHRVTPLPTPDWPGINGLKWLPDGSGYLVTVSDKQQPRQIWFLPRDGKGTKKITADLSMYASMSVTSDSRSVVAFRSDVTANLFLVDTQQPQKARALTTGMGNCFGTAGVGWLSPSSVIYTICGASPSLSVIDPGTGDSRELLRGSSWQPAVSPDRTRIAFVSERSGSEELWTCDTAGGHLQQLTNGKGPLSYPSWSPDGRAIYFMTNGQDQFVWRVSLDGKIDSVLAQPANTPTVSDDGKFLLCRLRSTDPKTQLWQTAVVPLAGGKPRILDVPKSGGPPRPQWVRGTTFAYLDSIGGVANVWTDDLEHRRPSQVTHFDSGVILAYDFSPDGRYLVMSHGEQVNDLVLIRDFR